MLTKISTLALGTMILASAAAAENGQLVDVDALNVFAPIGFDDNDETVVVVDGYLPSGCYRLTRPQVAVDQQTKTIKIQPQARYFDVPCIEARIPYHFDVKLGILAEGQYAVSVGTGAHSLAETLAVSEATTAGPDDFLYAAIDSATVTLDRATNVLTATIEGRFTSSCMSFQELRVVDNGKTLNVLPIMQVDDQGACVAEETPFKKEVRLPDSIQPGRHLLHVRSLNGQAVNYLFIKPR